MRSGAFVMQSTNLLISTAHQALESQAFACRNLLLVEMEACPSVFYSDTPVVCTVRRRQPAFLMKWCPIMAHNSPRLAHSDILLTITREKNHPMLHGRLRLPRSGLSELANSAPFPDPDGVEQGEFNSRRGDL